MNVILQALAHVVPIRDFFLQPVKYEEKVSELAASCLCVLVWRFRVDVGHLVSY